MARPRKEIDKEQFEKLCALQCTEEEIAGWFSVSPDTIDRFCKRTYKERFAAVFDKKRAPGKISIRRAQFRLAEKNATMAIWLGKQYLGQRDRYEVETNDNDLVIQFIEGMKHGDSSKPETG
ncbi:MAG: hypothetical protein PUC87_05505 [Galactobacillus timonensis]|nr:hypothetical protein [Galactobacillus timonensis]